MNKDNSISHKISSESKISNQLNYIVLAMTAFENIILGLNSLVELI